jgi:hypothetical protein
MTTASSTSSRIPDLVLEQHRLGELPADEALELARRLAGDYDLRRRTMAIAVSDQDVLHVRPADEFADAVRRRLTESANDTSTRRPRRWLVPAMSSAVVVVAALLLRRPEIAEVGAPATPPRPTEMAGDRLKGSGPALQVFMLGKGALDSGAVARAGDIVQIVYQAGGNRFGVIVSVDGNGRITRHFPLEGGVAGPLRAGGVATLSAAYRLDDAPRAERFYFVAASESFTADAVDAAARAAASDPATIVRLALPAKFAQASFLLKKE